VDLKSISNLIITHLTPKRMPSLRAFLEERASLGQLSIHLSNPALQLLRSTLGEPLTYWSVLAPCQSSSLSNLMPC
jgi:hypothetical protein